jgi:hypothetical protein
MRPQFSVGRYSEEALCGWAATDLETDGSARLHLVRAIVGSAPGRAAPIPCRNT